MAKIFKTDSQEKALADILEELKTVKSINKVLEAEEMQDFKIRTTGKTEFGLCNELIGIPFQIIKPVLKDYRKNLISDINQKAKNFSIQLDENELEIISKQNQTQLN